LPLDRIILFAARALAVAIGAAIGKLLLAKVVKKFS
jgi:hypothetical protein